MLVLHYQIILEVVPHVYIYIYLYIGSLFLCHECAPLLFALRLGLRNGWVGDRVTGIPDPMTLSGMGLDPSPSNTDSQYGTGMGLAPFPTTLVGRNLVPGTLSGMGPVPSLPNTRRRYWTGCVEAHPRQGPRVGEASSPYRPIPHVERRAMLCTCIPRHSQSLAFGREKESILNFCAVITIPEFTTDSRCVWNR
jgi:hypothetical protein